jgi:superfamily II DNA or RNA helicase
MQRDYKCNSKLRMVQQQAMDSVFDLINDGYRKLLVVAPPAVGKTVMFGGIAKHYMNVKPDSIVLILSHLGLLVTQSGTSLQKFWSLDTDILKADQMPSPISRCVLSTVQSSSMFDKILAWKSSLPHGRKVELILIDEAHINDGVDRVDVILKDYFPDAMVVGFTGSPFKNNKSMVGLFDKVAFSVSINDAVQMGLLVPPRLHGLQVDKKNIEDVMGKVIAIVRQSHSTDKCVVFMKSIKDSDKMAEMLNSIGIKASSVTSKVSGEARDKILADTRDNISGCSQVLVSVDVLSVGFDCPSLRAVIMPYGTGSVATYLQRIGRGLRTHQNKRHCDVYIGGADPKVEQGEWEKVNKKAMVAGTVEKEDYESEQATTVTLEEVKLKKALMAKGMNELANMIGDREFPRELLDHLSPKDIVGRYQKKAKVTDKQANLLGKYNINGRNMTMNEAATVINALAKKYKWMSASPVVPSGKFAGQKKESVPYSYIKLVSRYGTQYYNAELAKFFKGE